MKLYLSVIGIAMAVIGAGNILFGTAAWEYVVLFVVVCTVLQFALDGFLAWVIHQMPNRWFGVDNPFYRVSQRERRLYKRLRVKQWKDKVWELGGLGGFSKKNLQKPNDPAYIERFIIECNKGVLTHRLSYPIGFLVMLLMPNVCALTIGIPVATVNVFLNILPTLALRYNTPMLQNVLRRLRKKEERTVVSQ